MLLIARNLFCGQKQTQGQSAPGRVQEQNNAEQQPARRSDDVSSMSLGVPRPASLLHMKVLSAQIPMLHERMEKKHRHQ